MEVASLTRCSVGAVVIGIEVCIESVANASRGNRLNLNRDKVDILKVGISRIEDRSIGQGEGGTVRVGVGDPGGDIFRRRIDDQRELRAPDDDVHSLNCNESGTVSNMSGFMLAKIGQSCSSASVSLRAVTRMEAR